MNASPTYAPRPYAPAPSPISRTIRLGLRGTYPATACELARTGAGLSRELAEQGCEVGVIGVADGQSCDHGRVIGELVNGSKPSAADCAHLLNQSDVAVIQHDFGMYGGPGCARRRAATCPDTAAAGRSHGGRGTAAGARVTLVGGGRRLHQARAGPDRKSAATNMSAATTVDLRSR